MAVRKSELYITLRSFWFIGLWFWFFSGSVTQEEENYLQGKEVYLKNYFSHDSY